MAQVQFRQGIPGVLPSAWVIRPETPQPAPAVLAIHGLKRETDQMVDLLTARVDATGRTTILPIFDRASWPRYQRAACKNRSDWALLALLKVLRADGTLSAAPPDLSGFSGGAQFAHRFAWLYPEAVGHLCLVAPGWWTFPDARGAYPLGIGAGPDIADADPYRLRANLGRFLDRRIEVLVGALDTQMDRNLRQDPAVVAQQGRNRVERARAWTAAAIAAARDIGIRPDIHCRLMPDCGHGFGDCVANGGLAEAFIPASGTARAVHAHRSHPSLEEVA